MSSASPPLPPREAGAGPVPAEPRLARSAGLIGAATMTSRVLGLVRDQVLAYLFGAGSAVDAYNVAFRIPNLVRDLFAEGAMSAAFVPTFTRRLAAEGRASAWRLGSSVLNALVLVTGALVVAGLVFAEPLVRLFAGDYDAVPGKLELTVQLTRVMLPFLPLVALAAAMMGMLNALNRFFVPALAPAFFNVGSILSVLLLAPLMPVVGWPPITAMAIGVLVGGFLQLATQWPLLRREGFQYRPGIDVADAGLRQVLVLMGPGTIGLAAVQINVFVNTVLATGEGTGAVSWLNYAFRLMYLPIGLFGVSIAAAALPAISRRAAAEDLAGLRRTVSGGLGMMLMLNVPATLGLIVLARPIVSLLFERGAFGAADTEATAAALSFYAIGLAGYSAVKIASPAFYALNESRTPVAVSAMSVLVNVALNLALVRVFGYRGLALGTSLTAILNAVVLLGLLRRRLGGLDGRVLAGHAWRIAAASIVMAAVAWAAHAGLEQALPGRGLATEAVRVFGAIGASLVALGVAAVALGVTEFTEAMASIGRRVGRRPERGA